MLLPRPVVLLREVLPHERRGVRRVHPGLHPSPTQRPASHRSPILASRSGLRETAPTFEAPGRARTAGLRAPVGRRSVAVCGCVCGIAGTSGAGRSSPAITDESRIAGHAFGMAQWARNEIPGRAAALAEDTHRIGDLLRCTPGRSCDDSTEQRTITMIRQIDHLGIAVRSLDEAVPYYEEVLGLRCAGREEIASQKVRTAFFSVGGVHLELLEPTSPESPVAKFLEKHGPGIHHLAFATDDISGQLARARAGGARLIHEVPFEGAAGKRVAFLHPESTFGVLTEFCQKTC